MQSVRNMSVPAALMGADVPEVSDRRNLFTYTN